MNPFISVPATLLLVIRAYRRNSLTPLGIFFAALTAFVHGLHPSSIPFTLLVVFFLLGTFATKVKHDIKATLTISSSGSGGGEGPRSAIQVLANSGAASILILIQVYLYGKENDNSSSSLDLCFGTLSTTSELLLLGTVANYAAVTADTLSSELGILSKSRPRLITTLREVPPGTNGGVTFAGIIAGFCGSFVIGTVTMALLGFCLINPDYQTAGIKYGQDLPFLQQNRISFVLAVAIWGMLGSLLDSLLGAILQASVVDRRTGKVVEGAGGTKVKTLRLNSFQKSKKLGKEGGNYSEAVGSRFIGSGRDLLDNNQINFLMASTMSVGAIVGLYIWRKGA